MMPWVQHAKKQVDKLGRGNCKVYVGDGLSSFLTSADHAIYATGIAKWIYCIEF